jgi:DNA-binding transcriptional LysR family regulator
MDLRSFDLNLLVVLHTLISERSVSNTAKKLNLSQPATSAALKRLRVALGDRLLVRDGLQMVLTPRAEELLAPLEAILGEIERTLTSPEPFDPAKVERTMRIATNDYGAFILIPTLMNRLQSIQILTSKSGKLGAMPLPPSKKAKSIWRSLMVGH